MRCFVRGLLALVTGSALGCTSTATFLTRTRGNLEARIVGGDRQSLLVQSESGAETVLDRADVVDIDHPGNVVALVGGLVAGSGLLNLTVLGLSCSSGFSGGGSSSCGFIYAYTGSIAAVGLGMLTWGLWTWLTSRSLVVSTLQGPPPEAPVPSAAPARLPGERWLPRLVSEPR
jgi:hypothetical protein